MDGAAAEATATGATTAMEDTTVAGETVLLDDQMLHGCYHVLAPWHAFRLSIRC